MNALQRLLQDDLDGLVDRLASSTREGMLGKWGERRPDHLSRLDRAETELTEARRNLLEAYAAWREALDRCEDVWALTGLEAGSLPEVTARAA
jgi:hypothetical protein